MAELRTVRAMFWSATAWQHQGDVQRGNVADRHADDAGEPAKVVNAYIKFVKVKRSESTIEDM
jgi:hypothetical protein